MALTCTDARRCVSPDRQFQTSEACEVQASFFVCSDGLSPSSMKPCDLLILS